MEPDPQSVLINGGKLLMREILRTSNRIQLSWFQSVLAAEGIESFMLDDHMSHSYGGALIEIRLMVAEDDYTAAERLYAQAKAAGEF